MLSNIDVRLHENKDNDYMKILYTYHGLRYIGGVLRYYFEIINRIKKEHETEVISQYSNSPWLKDLAPYSKPFLYGLSFKGRWRLETLMQNSITYKKIRQTNFDVIHHTGEDTHVFKCNKHKPVVITIHDMIPELFSISKKRIANRKECIRQAHHIICVSQNTKNDLLNIYPEVDANKISVIYHGSEIRQYQHLPNRWGRYILYVGDRNAVYKDFFIFLSAVQNIKENIYVICTGKPFNKKEIQFIDRLAGKNQIVNVGFVDEQTLYSLYQHAVCFVYPSKYEGFGIPILEAWKNNCPICISNASCFPEIAGNAAAFFDPHDTHSMASTIESILYDDRFRDDLIRRGQERLSLFSWDNAAQQTIDVYQKLCGK